MLLITYLSQKTEEPFTIVLSRSKRQLESGFLIFPLKEDFLRPNLSVDGVGLRYSNPYVGGHEEFIDITLWRDSLNGVIVYGKW